MSAKAPDPWPHGTGRLVLDSVGSTNAEAVKLAPGPAWVVAGQQSEGRGRRGRPWASPPGNFYGSLILSPTEPPEVVALRSFAAALALHEACVTLTGLPQAFALKWPNDVLLNDGKLAGILLESAGAGQGVAHLVIGIGVNLISAPDPALVEPGALRPVSLLGETGLRVTPGAFLDHLAPAYARWEARFRAEGFAPLRAAWLAHAARLGAPIRARTGTQTHEGIFETIDSSGALVLHQGGTRRAIPAAEVFF